MYKITENIKETNNRRRLEGGEIHTNVRLVGAEYEKADTYESMKLTFEGENGIHEERIFPIGDKVFPKDIYKDNKIVGKETEAEARERTENEWLTKALHIATKFTGREELEKATARVNTFQEFAKAFIKVLGNYSEVALNIKLVYKSGTTYACFPKTVKSGGFIEIYEEGKPSNLKFSNYEKDSIKTARNIENLAKDTNTSEIDLDSILGH